jgi:competence protein ComEA
MKRLIAALALLVGLALAPSAAATVNINTATKDELVGLPGIGPAKAQAIVDYRNQHGPFRSVEDVRKVKGIGEKLFLQIRPELVVSGGASRPAAGGAAKADSKADPKADAKGAARNGAGAIAKDEKAKK